MSTIGPTNYGPPVIIRYSSFGRSMYCGNQGRKKGESAGPALYSLPPSKSV